MKSLKKFAIGLLKISISAALLGYLFSHAWGDDSFAQLRSQPKHWGLLLAAFAVAMGAVCSTFFRWYLLVRALQIPFQIKDAFRWGFVGFLFNFFTVGVVGGDVIKAIFVARGQKGRRTEAVASVVVDRVIGLYALFVVAALSFYCVDLTALNVRDPADLAAINRAGAIVTLLAVVGAIGIGVLLLPGFTTSSLWDMLVHLPKIGPTVDRLIGAVRMYRRRAPLLALTLLMSLGTHSLFTVSIYLVALGLPGGEPSLPAHFVIVPLSMAVGAVPLPGGLGAFEFALDFLYRTLSSAAVAERQGFVIALAFLVIKLSIASVGMAYYLVSRREVEQLRHEAEEEPAD